MPTRELMRMCSTATAATSPDSNHSSPPCSPNDEIDTNEVSSSACFVCVYSGCLFMRQRRRHNAERHVWNQHLRRELRRDKEAYCAREHRELVRKYITPVEGDSNVSVNHAAAHCAYIQPKPMLNIGSVATTTGPQPIGTPNAVIFSGSYSTTEHRNIMRMPRTNTKFLPFSAEMRGSPVHSNSNAMFIHSAIDLGIPIPMPLSNTSSMHGCTTEHTVVASGDKGIWRPW